MGTNLVLSEQVGQAFLAELVQGTQDSIQVKQKLKGYSECNPDPNAVNPATMATAFNTAIQNQAVVERLHEMRDSLPSSTFATRKVNKFSLVPIASPVGIVYDTTRHFVGGTSTYPSGYTNSQELKFRNPFTVDDGITLPVGTNLVNVENYQESSNSLRVTETGVYLLHGVMTYRVARAFNPASDTNGSGLLTTPSFLTANASEALYHRMYVSVNANTSAAQSNTSTPPSLDPAAIVNRLDTYYVKELHAGKFTKNEITKGTIKTRGFSLYLKLTLNDIVSLQWQRGKDIAHYGQDGNSKVVNDSLVLQKTTATNLFDPLNWVELVRMV